MVTSIVPSEKKKNSQIVEPTFRMEYITKPIDLVISPDEVGNTSCMSEDWFWK